MLAGPPPPVPAMIPRPPKRAKPRHISFDDCTVVRCQVLGCTANKFKAQIERQRAEKKLWRTKNPELAAEEDAMLRARRKNDPMTVGGMAILLAASLPSLLALPVVDELKHFVLPRDWPASLLGVAALLVLWSGLGRRAGGRGSTTQFYAPSRRVWEVVGLLCLPQLAVDIVALTR
jgi:hypothetical protein